MAKKAKQTAAAAGPADLSQQITKAVETALAAMGIRRDFGAWFPPVAAAGAEALDEAAAAGGPRRDHGPWFPPIVPFTQRGVGAPWPLPPEFGPSGPRRDHGPWFPPAVPFTARRDFGPWFPPVVPFHATRDFGAWFPPVQVVEDGQEIQISAEVPGMALDELEVTLDGNVLTIAGEKRPAAGAESAPLGERYYGRFSRAVTLPEVEPASVQASYEQGVLTVTAKRAKGALPRRIAIKG
jgi:HSP20 family protein